MQSMGDIRGLGDGQNGSKSASNVQAGAAGELGSQNHGLSWQMSVAAFDNSA